jgi:hypothetical protein
MLKLATAGRDGRWFQRVTVYRCEICGRRDAQGESADPGWVSAKAGLFLELRREAYERAGLNVPSQAVAVFDLARRRVIFG